MQPPDPAHPEGSVSAARRRFPRTHQPPRADRDLGWADIWAREPGLRSLLARSAAGPALTRPVPEAASNR